MADRITLYRGHLSEMPGRAESWTEYLSRLSKDSWELRNEGTNFSGLAPEEPIVEVLTTAALVKRLHELDMMDSEGASIVLDADGESNARRRRPRIRALRTYARRMGEERILEEITSFDRSRRFRKGRPPRIQRLVEVRRFGSYHSGGPPYRLYAAVETSAGAGIVLIPQSGENSVQLRLASHPFASGTCWRVRIRKEIREQIDKAIDSLPGAA